MTIETFFIVLRQHKGGQWALPPHPHKHDTFELAKAEAERLATDNRGSIFYVFSSEGEAFVPEPTIWKKHDEIPF